MQRFLRSLLAFALLATATTGLLACGGDDDAATASVDELLNQTFSGSKDVKSGKLGLDVKVDIRGGGSQVQGPITIKLGGPFESQGTGKLPKFDLDLQFDGAGQNIRAGATSTGDKGFINFNGQEYAVSDQIFSQFKSGFEQASKQGGDKKNQSLASLGIDPRRWLTNAKNEGEAKVGDADTIKITGGVNVSKLLDDVNTALGKAGQLGLQGQAQLPTRITDEQKKQVADAVKDLKVEIYTGKDDKILRRMVIALNVENPGSEGGSADIGFDLSLLDLNEGQDIKAPSNTKPFDELVGQLGGLGLGGLGGSGSGSAGGGSSGSGGGSSGSGSSSTENLEKYTECIEKAGNDLQKAQACADLLTG